MMVSVGVPSRNSLVAKLLRAVWVVSSSHFLNFTFFFSPALVKCFSTSVFKRGISFPTSFRYWFVFWLEKDLGSPFGYFFNILITVSCRGMVTGSPVFSWVPRMKPSFILSVVRVE